MSRLIANLIVAASVDAARAIVRSVLVIAVGAALLACVEARAAPTDCIGTSPDGVAECTLPVPLVDGDPSRDAEGFTNQVCDARTDFPSKTASWCQAMGCAYAGVYVGGCNEQPPNPPCAWPVTMDEHIAIEKKSIEIWPWGGGPACNVQVTLAFGQTQSPPCWGGPGSLTQNGYLIRDVGLGDATFTVGAGCSQPGGFWVNGLRSRQLTCPPGFSTRGLPNGAPGDIQCYRMPCAEKCPTVGNPVLIATAGKVQREVDIAVPALGGLEFVRTFDSSSYLNEYGGLPTRTWDFWHHTYSRRIVTLPNNAGVLGIARRENGASFYFGPNGRQLANVAGGAAILEKLTGTGGILTGWRYTSGDKDVELYDAAGRLSSITTRIGLTQTLTYSTASTPAGVAPAPGYLLFVTDHFGRMIQFGYDAAGRLNLVSGLISASNPVGPRFAYGYDARGNLSTVTMPDGKVRSYLYQNYYFPRLLTGIVDENGVQYATFDYHPSGFVSLSRHAGDVDRHEFQVPGGANSATHVVTYKDPSKTTYTHVFGVHGGALRNTSIQRTCDPSAGCGAAATSTSTMAYDNMGNLVRRLDYQGNRTDYTYDSGNRNLEATRIEGRTQAGGNPVATSATRTISTQWHPTYRAPVAIAEPLRKSSFGYDSSGNLLTRTIQGTNDPNGSAGFAASPLGTPRTWSYTYTNYGRVQAIDGPRIDVTDVTTFIYYADTDSCVGCRGHVKSMRNALDQTTTYDSYDSNGRLTRMTDPNGVVTTMTYFPRGWLKSKTVNAGQSSAETTAYDYDGAGQLALVVLPDGSFLSYHYDDAHRLWYITDSLDNLLEFKLDAAGNRVGEYRFDAQDALLQKQAAVYDGLNRLQRQIGGTNPVADVTTHAYDKNGNRLSTVDALARSTAQAFDARGRLTQVTDAYMNPVLYDYDQLDRLIRVTDPRGLVTRYDYDAQGNLRTLTSPDTGITQYALYDEAGNLRSRTDARNQTTSYVYDALNRLASQVVANAPGATYTYDQGAFGIGRVRTIAEGGGNSTQFAYDAFGRVVSKSQTLHGRTLQVGYGYAPGGKLKSITYPSGRVLLYDFDAAGRINGIRIDQTTLLNRVTWQPFGPVTGWVWGSGAIHQRFLDLDGRVETLRMPTLPPDSQSFDYDRLNRVRSAASSVTGLALAYEYDATGNRTKESKNGALNTYNYSAPFTSNRQQAITGAAPRTFTFNASGSITGENGASYTFDGRERLVATGSTTYYVNALGQRTEKSGPGADTPSGVRQFVYDESGHLLGEYDAASGNPVAEHFYLGDWPVGVLAAGSLYHVHPDQLGTPRAVTLATNNSVVWYWDTDQPFGEEAANSNPGGTGTFNYHLRFPGQYFDGETGKHYNYFRDYDPTTGRYAESDPVGLVGGLNTYAYVENNPLSNVDPYGLAISTRTWRPSDPPPSSCGREGGTQFPNAGAGFSFEQACQNHDRCYRTCGPSQAECDMQFLNDMIAECARIPWVLAFFSSAGRACRGLAYSYYAAVVGGAANAYRNAQRENGCCK